MTEPFYREIIKKSWAIAWRYKFLWLIGLFSGLLGTWNEIDIFFDNFSRIVTGSETITASILYQSNLITGVYEAVKIIFAENPIWAIIVLAILLFVLWLIFVAQPALVYSAARAEEKKELGLANSFRVGRSFFGQALALNVIWKIIIYGSWFIVGVPLVALISKGENVVWKITFAVFSIIILVFLNIIVSFITKYSLAFVVLKSKGILESIKAGWSIFAKNWLISLEMAVILFVINFFLYLGLAIATMLVVIPLSMIAIIFYLAAVPSFTSFIITAGIIIMPAIILIGVGLIATFQYSSWTLIFLRLVEGKGISKLYRMISGQINK